MGVSETKVQRAERMRARRAGKAQRVKDRGHRTGGGNGRPALRMSVERRTLIYMGQNGAVRHLTPRQIRRLQLKGMKR